MNPVRGRMTMRCTIERNFQVDGDDYGQKGPGDWRELHPDLPCHCWAGPSGGRHTTASDSRTLTLDMPGMVVPKGTDVRATDRVASIRDRRGTELFRSMYIDAVMPRPTHVELRLRGVS